MDTVPMPREPDTETDDEPLYDGPSKSSRKRAAQAAQDLGTVLIGLRDKELDALDLPERLKDAIVEARRLTSRLALARQRQYIGKIMRDIDLEPIRAILDSRDEKTAIEAQRFKRIEQWRDRLIAEGLPALNELAIGRPQIDLAEWTRKVDAARTERARIDAVGPAARELFRTIRAVFEGD